MSLVQGYSSSEEEIESQEENAINHKRQKTLTNTFQKILYDPAAFDANSQQSKLKEAKAKAKELKLRRKRNGGDPWASIHSEEEQVYKPEPAQILKEEEEEEEENTELEKFHPVRNLLDQINVITKADRLCISPVSLQRKYPAIKNALCQNW